jgi:hypothetical protein
MPWAAACLAGQARPTMVPRAAEPCLAPLPSPFVPTLIAQQLFQPTVLDTEEEEALGEEDLSIIHNRPGPA